MPSHIPRYAGQLQGGLGTPSQGSGLATSRRVHWRLFRHGSLGGGHRRPEAQEGFLSLREEVESRRWSRADEGHDESRWGGWRGFLAEYTGMTRRTLVA